MAKVVNLIQIFREDLSAEDYYIALEILKDHAVFFTLVRDEKTNIRIRLLKENERKLFNGFYRFLNDKWEQAHVDLEDHRVETRVVTKTLPEITLCCDNLVLDLYYLNEQTVNILKMNAKGFFSLFMYGLAFFDKNMCQVLVSVCLEDTGYVINNAVAREFIDRLESFTFENRVFNGTEMFM